MKLRKITTGDNVKIVRSFFYDIFWEESDYIVFNIAYGMTRNL